MTTRRRFLATGMVCGGGVLLGARTASTLQAMAQGEAAARYPLNDPGNQIFTCCLQCNTGCPIKVKVYDGVAAKLDGNPITPWTMFPHLPYDSPLAALAGVDGAICARGQAGILTAYDPYRIRKVLKRVGPRGSGKWLEIPFEQAVREVAEGGRLFESIGDDRHYPGLQEMWALRDPEVAGQMRSAVAEIWSASGSDEKRRKVAAFRERFRDHLHTLIDPEHPDLGPKNNQVTFAWGRLKGGRRDFFNYFFNDTLGTTNMHGHTTVCQGSLYFAAKAMSDRYAFDSRAGGFQWGGGRKAYWQADLGSSEFVIFVGSNIYEGGYGMPLRTSKVTQRTAEGKMRFAVVDPRAGKSVAHAARWIAPKPGTDAAIALGMMRWIFDADRFNRSFLAAANRAAAVQAGEPTWTNATWLVRVGEDGRPGALLRGSEVGLPALRTQVSGREVSLDPFVTMVGGVPTPVDPEGTAQAVAGDLFVDTRLRGVRVKSALQLVRDEADRHSVEGWAELAGVSPQDVRWLAREFTSHGRRAVVDLHRGVSQHTNGFYNVLTWYTLCALIGNWDYQGGLVWHSNHGTGSGAFSIGGLHPRKMVPFGVSQIRHELDYEQTTLFAGYPAKRPWYPFSSDVYQETIPSAAQGYPYRTRILFHYMGDPAYSLPAGDTQVRAMLDPDAIGLIVALDIGVGNSYSFADYIVPDLSYLERWEFHGSHPNVIWKTQPVRQPAIPPIPDTVKVFGEEVPICAETFLMGLAEHLRAPGYGDSGFSNGMPFRRPEEFYLKQVANLASVDTPVREATEDELKVFRQARRHLPGTVFDEAKWRAAVGENHWLRVVNVLNRGGRFEDFGDALLADGTVKNKYGRQVNLYLEKLTEVRNAMTGQPYWPLAAYIPPYQDCLGRAIEDGDEFDLTLITHRISTMTKSRTISNYWLLNVRPENHVEIAAHDARRLNLRDGDEVKVISAGNTDGVWNLGPAGTLPMVGKVKVRQGLRPGTVTFALGYGHWAQGSADVIINDRRVRRDPRRARGINANAAMRADPVLGDMSLTDMVGGSAVFYETGVRLLKV